MGYHPNSGAISGQVALALQETGKELVLAVASNQVGVASFKSGTEIFTQLDLWAEKQLKARLLEILPGSRFIGEEEHSSLSLEVLRRRISEESPLWVVDPIDGTNNFCNLIPHFAISVALFYQGRIVLGMIYDPNRNELYHAEKDKGAFRNGAPITPSGTDSLSNSLVSFYFPVVSGRLAPFWTQIERAVVRARASRSHGCATLDLCWIACGRMELALMSTLQPWDLAAGYLVASEAGVVICNYPEIDSEFDLFGSHFVFATPAIWQEVRRDILVS